MDFKAFQGRFGFCLADQLPTLPALLLDGSPRWPAHGSQDHVNVPPRYVPRSHQFPTAEGMLGVR